MVMNKRVALVTGASSGFGKLTVARLTRLGFEVFGTSRAGTGELLALDVDSEESVADCVAQLARRAGRLDLLVNNAGRALLGACEETSAEEARALFETNFFGVLRMVSAVLPMMRAQGSATIVNIGSASGFVGIPFHGVYAASKHALAGYSEALRAELAPFGIRVALIEPSAHRTGIRMSGPRVPMAIYDRGRAGVGAVIQAQIERGPDPERVVDAIAAAATSLHPKARYRVGRQATRAALGRRFLPGFLFERVVRREFRLPG
ncbi:MAG: oxidoreductase [Myxococcaceae bacterium]|nr:oxidoreductase [Myxococcaceae bacterium]